MPNIEELRDNRLKKLNSLQGRAIDPFPISTKRTHTVAQAIKDFAKISKSKKEIVLVGRVMSIRRHGAIAFINFMDGTAKIQGCLRIDTMGEKNYEFFFDHFDMGDFIEAQGSLITSKTGEKTLSISDYKFLAKSLLPLPEKWHGLQDIEERYRKRYLDLIFNEEQKERFVLRSKIINSIREYMVKKGFMEVETPILQPLYGGAKARPFKTHLNAFDMDVFLRVAPELYLKRLIVGGFEKIFELGKCFRNEGVDKSHNPDFTMMEFYWAYADYKEMMKYLETMLFDIVKKVYKTGKVAIGDNVVNFKPPFPRIEFNDLLKKYAHIEFDEMNRDAMAAKAKELGVDIEKGSGKAEIADEIYKKYCRPQIIQPTFIIHHPLGFQTLAKRKNENRLASIQLIIAGTELVNAFSELNDPVEQKARFDEQQKLFKQGFSEAHQSDQEFLEALEYGMPPCAGCGIGIDRLIMLLTNSTNLREVIPFPTMKPKQEII